MGQVIIAGFGPNGNIVVQADPTHNALRFSPRPVDHRDNLGRIGALREIDGVKRFFLGLTGNWAFERYLTSHPDLGGSHART